MDSRHNLPSPQPKSCAPSRPSDVKKATNNCRPTIRSLKGCPEIDNLKILSWNIHDSSNGKEGKKVNDDEFRKILTSCPIFCLQETKDELFIPDYQCFNTLRKGTRSGGLCIGVHRSISKQIQIIKTDSPDIQSVKISLGQNSNHKELTIVNVYDSPEHSSFKSRMRLNNSSTNISTLDTLLEFSMKNLDQGGLIYLAGDFNARTASLNFEFTADDPELEDTISSHSCDTVRNSKDKVVNARGKLFLDFIACTNLSLLNGSTLGDVLGEFTSVNYNGSSVVDYVATNQKLRDLIRSFTVQELTKYSDHKPCITTLVIKHNFTASEEILDLLQDAPSKYKWPADDIIDTRFSIAMDDTLVREKAALLATRSCSTKEEVFQMNADIVDLYRDVADTVIPRKPATATNSKRQKRGNRMKAKNSWFDITCIRAKRNLNMLAKNYGRSPQSDYLREAYYSGRRAYNKLIKKKKEDFIAKLCSDIEKNNNVKWESLKTLKKYHSSSTELDAFDMINFCKFFKNLYGKATIEAEKIDVLRSEMAHDDTQDELVMILDEHITLEELTSCIRAAKKGKAVSEDLIPNEFLKASTKTMLNAVLNLFNQCLILGVYPWTTSIVTPLHKKGSVYDPNNYRAIAVASNLGKTFASILLKRLIAFRNSNEPDTQNQLGFCRGAQTSDHIFTLTTCIEKYVKRNRKRIYSCFVDYAKAFDSVCREALLYKLWKMGIKGSFFKCIEFMYQNSSTKVKLLNKLSDRIDVVCGTEQGHPMSPELFKCFIHQLSKDINSIEGLNVPLLGTAKITHLLWADDLVLLALDRESLQAMLNVLQSYCLEWGLSVNVKKTAIMVFNPTGRLLKDSLNFKLGESTIPSTREYCYLGINFTLSGSLKAAQATLRQKALRGYFAVKRMLDIRHVRKSILFKIFDALIQPIATYACQVWLPGTNLFKAIADESIGNTLLQSIALDPLENLHLSFLKWTMNVHKYTSNAAVWGDCGRYPLGVILSKTVFRYKERLQEMDCENSDALVRHAYSEQKQLNLTWYRTLADVKSRLETGETRPLNWPSQIRSGMKNWFERTWNTERFSNRKLKFYNSIKHVFEEELYLRLGLDNGISKRIAQLRSSSHNLNVETGRYGENRLKQVTRVCKHCCTEDEALLELLLELPLSEPIIEDENHVLLTCPLYEDLRQQLLPATQNLLENDFGSIFENAWTIRDIGNYISKIFERRQLTYVDS